MAARTFEELVNAFIDEYDIGGGDPLETQDGQVHAVVGQSGDLGRAVRLIQESWKQIANRWRTWKFLWFEYTNASGLLIATSTPVLPTAYSVRQWDRKRFVLNRGTDDPILLTWQPHATFFEDFQLVTAVTGPPSRITVLPNNSLRVDTIADATYAFYAQGWRAPTALTIDSSVPDLPESYDRLIINGAAILYADKVDAPEWLEGAQAEYLSTMAQLESDQLESFEFDTMDRQDIDLQFLPPGEPSLRTLR